MNRYIFSSFLVVFLIQGCSTRGVQTHNYAPTKNYTSANTHAQPDNKTYSHPTMRPYVIRGIRYHPHMVGVGDRFEGNASWYGPDFHGKLTSNGETYNMHDMTAAHKTLPMNTIVRVTNKRNGKQVVVRINDRGPFIATRIIDLSKTAASKIDMVGAGTAPVTLEVLGFEVKGRKAIPSAKELRDAPQKTTYGEFALQIGSFSKIDGALATQEKYDKLDGYKTIIKDIDTKNGRVFKVLLKGFKTEEEARDYKSQGHFQDAFIVGEG